MDWSRIRCSAVADSLSARKTVEDLSTCASVVVAAAGDRDGHVADVADVAADVAARSKELNQRLAK